MMRDYSPIQRGELIEECYRKDAEIDRLRALNEEVERRLYELVEAAQALFAAVERTNDHTEWFESLAKLHAAVAADGYLNGARHLR